MNHKLHILISVITFGGWLLFYALLFIIFKLSGSTIEKRRELKKANEANKVEQRKANYAKEVKLLQANKGYKQGKNQMYVLSCTHQIRAKKTVGLISKGLVGKTVWCDVCKAERLVTGMPYWVK